MKRKILSVLLPVLTATMAVMLVLIATRIVREGVAFRVFRATDSLFLIYFLPEMIMLCGILQLVVITPVWRRWTLRYSSGFQLILRKSALLALISGFVFGLLFWERPMGWIALASDCATDTIVLSVYWIVNLYVLYRMNPTRQDVAHTAF